MPSFAEAGLSHQQRILEVASTPRFGGCTQAVHCVVHCVVHPLWIPILPERPRECHRAVKRGPKRRAKDIKGAPHDVPGLFDPFGPLSL